MAFQSLEGRADAGLLPVQGARSSADPSTLCDFVKNLEQVPVNLSGENHTRFEDSSGLAHRLFHPLAQLPFMTGLRTA
jgi:hypothetical protein